jgi:microcompartment protein CcmK/EutM
MKMARVIGRVVCSRKYPTLEGKKLLLIEPLNWDDGKSAGDPLVAADCVGAGAAEKVFFVQSREALVAFQNYEGETAAQDALPPVDASIVGIIDGYQVKL